MNNGPEKEPARNRDDGAKELLGVVCRPAIALKTQLLASGETLEIKIVYAPAPELFNAIWQHQMHMNGNDWYKRIFKQRLEGKYASECVDAYFIGEIAGEIAGLLWYGYPIEGSGVGNWGDVLTAERHRGKGVMKALLDVFSQDFKANTSVKALLCDVNPKAMDSYAKIGWRLIRENPAGGGPAYLLHPLISAQYGSFDDFEKDYFAPGRKVSIQQGTMSHRHDVDKLLRFSKTLELCREQGRPYNNSTCYLPDTVWAQRYGMASPVSSYMDAVFRCEDGKGVVAAAVAEGGNVVGWAFCLKTEASATSHAFDFSIHKNYASEASELIAGTLRQARASGIKAIHAYCRQGGAKAEAFLKAGFKPVASLDGYFEGGFDGGRNLAILSPATPLGRANEPAP